MADTSPLTSCPPDALVDTRHMTHQAMQLLSKAALANLEPVDDYSHTNMGWDIKHGAFLTQPITTAGGDLYVGLVFASLTLTIVRGGAITAQLDLNGISDNAAGQWLDAQLAETGLKPASAMTLFYDLPAEVTGITTYSSAGLGPCLVTLGHWFAFADGLLSTFANANAALNPGPSPVRCWPHHFDIATYVSLEEGDFETAKGIGVGLSPGDGSYAQPYFYVTPFPAPDLAALPPAPAPGHWHSEGFVGAIATGEELLTLDDIASGAAAFVDQAFAIGREKLGV